MDDLERFIARDDLDPLTQAAIAHGQFETIHPFLDGNGPVGRALVYAILRRRGLLGEYIRPIPVLFALYLWEPAGMPFTDLMEALRELISGAGASGAQKSKSITTFQKPLL
ncbi:MAG: Fic family protein [Solirubrobacteraceae bacterium]